jgi:uroporphyrinogen decarboxylase
MEEVMSLPLKAKPKNKTVTTPILIQALKGQKCNRIPFWYMRQAGRYLPEYNELRRGRSFLEMSTDPDIAFEITIQPHRRFQTDGLILFADILTPVHACGISLHFEEKLGPVLEKTITEEEDLHMLEGFSPAAHCSYIGETLQRLSAYASSQKDRPAVLGFAGAPFTMASYLVEGGTSKKFEKIRSMMFGQPELYHQLCNRLADITVDYLRYQMAAGAEAVQIFDSWAGILSAGQYEEFAGSYTGEIIRRLKAEFDHPIILFVGGGHHLLPEMVRQNPDAISLDWRVRMEDVAEIPSRIAIQGNLDPLYLYGSRDRVIRETEAVLNRFASRPGYVFNLGHGIHPASPLENVEAMIQTIRNYR